MNPKCCECGCALDAEDAELNDDLCSSCREAVIYQEVYKEKYNDYTYIEDDE